MRALNRPTAKQARTRGAEAYQAGNSLQSNPYKHGYADTRPAKWWGEGWMKEAQRG
jgi:hypothetical protein